MFFSSSCKRNNLINTVTEAVAAFFAIAPEKLQGAVDIDADRVIITLPFAAASQYRQLQQSLQSRYRDFTSVTIRHRITSAVTKQKRLARVNNIIAVSSGKGGVGKSTTSVNLAFALQQEGARVGLLDADIYGPSLPIMLGNPQAHPSSADQKHMQPLQAFGVYANSIGYILPATEAAIWRGPMVSRALQQLVNETLWPSLDYLVVDMPPGTGDIQLTLAQQVPVSAAVIVTTPQDLALADAVKGIAMFEKVNIPVLGVVENMSYYQCKKCGNQEAIFASDGGKQLAQKHAIDLLAQLPLDTQIRQHADGGKPLLVAQPDSFLSASYRQAARVISQNLALTVPQDETAIDFVEKH